MDKPSSSIARQKRLRSFDVFDTLLVRSTASPIDLFQILGTLLKAEGLIHDESSVFALRRAQAEAEARRGAPNGEVNFVELYDALAGTFGWQTSQTARARQIELDVEERNLRAVPGMREKVTEARRESENILFLSDMYLPASFIEMALRREGLFLEGDLVVVSCELRKSKSSGDMFEEIRRRFPATSDWIHVGDNTHSDFEVPGQRGIIARLETRCRLTRFEAAARGPGSMAPLWRSRLAAAMRYARLRGSSHRESAANIWATGADVVGPLWFSFTEWCLEQALNQNLRRLYFIARDGQILQQVAQRMAGRRSLPVECRYLYGSRQAWHLPAIERMDDTVLAWLFNQLRFLSVEQVFGRVGLTPLPFAEDLHRIGLPTANWQQNLTPAECARLRGLVCRPEVERAILQAAAVQRKDTIGYLEQEGVLDGSPFAIVDLGWHGNMQRSLSRLLRLAGRREGENLTGLYFGLLKNPELDAGQRLLSFWPSTLTGAGPIADQNIALLEMLAAADHGSVMRFRKEGARFLPVFDGEENDRALRWGLRTLQEAVLSFTDEWLASEPAADYLRTELHALVRELFTEFAGNPSFEEASVWAAFPHSADQLERHFESFAPRMSFTGAVRAILRVEERPVGWWMEGTQAIAPTLPLALYLRLRRLRRKLVRRQ